MIHLRVVRSTSELEPLVPQWHRLLANAANAEPILTPTWMLNWLRTFEDSMGRLTVAVMTHLSGELAGLAFFGARTLFRAGMIPFRRLQLLPSGEKRTDEVFSENIGVLAHRDHLDAVALELASALASGGLGAWDELVMPAVNSEDPFLPCLVSALARHGLAASTNGEMRSFHAPLPATWEQYLSTLPGRHRYWTRRAWREFEAWAGQDGYLLCRAASAKELERGFAILRDLHTMRWHGAGAFASERFVRFHTNVMPHLLRGDGGTLDLSWLVVRGTPIAALYNIVYNGRVYNYQSGRRVDVPKQVRPGIVIHLLAIRRAIERGCGVYDFMAGDAQYKRQLATESRSIVRLRVVARSPRARLVESMRLSVDRVRGRRPAAHPFPPS